MIFTEKEIYTLNGERQDLPGFDVKYLNIVDYILKITDDIWEKKQIHVINETYTNDVVIHTGAEIITGINTVIQGTINTLFAFPDRKMGGEAVIWSSDGEEKYLSSHRIGSTATNLGATIYGPATNKKVFFRTIADCAVKDNKIYEEWLVRDNLAIINQLGFNPMTLAKSETKYNGKQSLAYNNIESKTNSSKIIPFDKSEKLIFDLLNSIWIDRSFSNIENSYKSDAKIFTIDNQELSTSGYIKLIDEVLSSFSNSVFEICRITKNRNAANQEEIAVRWRFSGSHDNSGYFGPPTHTPVMFYGVSHFVLEEGLIKEEYSIFDAYDIMCQIHADNHEDRSAIDNRGNQKVPPLTNKILAKTMIDAINTSMNNGSDVESVLEAFIAQDAVTMVSDPIGELKGVQNLYHGLWKDIIASFPDMEIQPYILIGGEYNGKQAVSIAGNIIGTFEKDWLSIPANNQPTYLRYSMQLIYEEGKIVNQWIYMDILSVIQQSGYELFPVLGVDQIAPIPHSNDGLKLNISDPDESKKSFDLVKSMIEGLLRYDQKDISSMQMDFFWDVNNMMWYGPSGIGTTKGLVGFQNYHQIPFLKAFPDRGVDSDEVASNYINIADGNYVCHFGHNVMNGTHSGPDWLGLEPSGKTFDMSVQDFWRCENGKLVENWVMLDLVNVLSQFGIDVFKLLEEKMK